MTERLTDQERRGLLAGDRGAALAPEEAAELGVLADVLADPATWSEPDAALEERVVRAVVAAEPAPTTGRAPTAAAQGRARAGRGHRFMLAAVAAAASVAIVVGVLVATRPSADPDFRSRLTATALAPGARASAEITRNTAGFRITLDAHGLARLHDRAYYQAWLKNAGGGLVSIGTFSSSDGGIVLWSGVSPEEYQGISVTIEPDDDNPASSGRRVLIGTIRAT